MRIPGRATPEGTARYAARFSGTLPAQHFRMMDAVTVSTIGLGTYLGREDTTTDGQYEKAITRALGRGVNVVDSAVNYRLQRSERAVGAALTAATTRGGFTREEIVVATKGGFIPFDGEMPPDPGAYFSATYLKSGIVRPNEVVGGMHCMAPRYLADQIERSRANLGVDTIDVYYLHNPETQLDELDRAEFRRRIVDAFRALEEAASAGNIARYGVATWNGLRQEPTARDYLSLPDLVATAREAGGPDHRFRVVQLPYNLAMPEAFTRANQRFDDGLVPVLEAARRLNVYVMASASVYQGQLTRNLPPVLGDFLPGLSTDAQRALQFVRSTPGIGTALVGMKSLAHVDDNTGVAPVPPVSWEQFQRMFSAV